MTKHETTDHRFERELAELLAAEGEAARLDAEPPSSARVWWRAEMRARQEAVQAVNRPLTFVHAVAIACGIGLLFGIAGIAFAWLRGSAWLSRAYESFAAAATPLASAIGARWLAVSLTATIATVVICSVAALLVMRDE